MALNGNLIGNVRLGLFAQIGEESFHPTVEAAVRSYVRKHPAKQPISMGLELFAPEQYLFIFLTSALAIPGWMGRAEGAGGLLRSRVRYRWLRVPGNHLTERVNISARADDSNRRPMRFFRKSRRNIPGRYRNVGLRDLSDELF
jgi:hypothetical protein